MACGPFGTAGTPAGSAPAFCSALCVGVSLVDTGSVPRLLQPGSHVTILEVPNFEDGFIGREDS
jgi:hypothetical protein